MTHKKSSIKEFLLSLAGKGWLWGTGKEIVVNPEYAHLLQGQSHYSVSSSPFGSMNSESWSYLERELGRKKNVDEEQFRESAKKAMERLATAIDPHQKEQFPIIGNEDQLVNKQNDFQDKHKHELTEIDFMCAWWNICLCLPDECDLFFYTTNIFYSIDTYPKMSTGKRRFRFPFFLVSVNESCFTIRDIDYKDCPNIEESFELLQAFLDQRIFKDYEWMFKSVKYVS